MRRKRQPEAPKRPYFVNQPHRCAGGESGWTGNCLACGAYEGEKCRIPLPVPETAGQTVFLPAKPRGKR